MAKRQKRPTRKEKIAASRAAEKAAIEQAAASLDQPKPKLKGRKFEAVFVDEADKMTARPKRDFIGMKKDETK